MINDLNKVDADLFIDKEYDVCICGAGAAGISIALKLSRRLKVILLEAGDYDYSQDSQDVYKGESVGREYYDLTSTRLRFLGGTTNHWSGWCRQLDDHDFKRKTYEEYSGWPISSDDLNAYTDEARSILDIPSSDKKCEYDLHESISSDISKSNELRCIKFWWSAPTRFGKKYRDQLGLKKNIECFLNASVTNIGLTNDYSSVNKIEVQNYSGKKYIIRSRITIVAMGGIENPRLLLNCNQQVENGLGNKFDLVGRFFTEHLHHEVGSFILSDNVKKYMAKNWSSDWTGEGNFRRFFSPTYELMKKEEMLNYGMRFRPNKPVYGYSFKERMKNIVCDSDFAKSAIEKVRGEGLYCDTFNNNNDGTLTIAAEQAPNPYSRITIGRDVDKFGMGRPVLNWKLSEIDKHTIKRASIHFGETLAKLDLGRMRVTGWLEGVGTNFELPGFDSGDEVAGHHHMCTTKMSDSPRNGVVDSNQQVFGIDNLYIAGSSVFSTGGHANPTFTIVQMSLRLADHINKKLIT